MNRTKQPAFHGSDLEQIEKYYKIPKERIVSFGANVNPLGLSPLVKERLSKNLDVLTRYPDRDYVALRSALASYCHIPSDYILVGNGSTELISLLITVQNARHALVIGPTYSEYRRELTMNGGRISTWNLKEAQDFRLDLSGMIDAMPEDVDLLILCNPNNPTSSALRHGELTELLRECKKRNVFLMIDETYAEFAPEMETVTAIPLAEAFDNFMVIRGVSKFFAAPGLRLGYGVTSNKTVMDRLKERQNPWSLSSIAALAGEYMLQDTDYICRTKTLISTERARMCEALKTFRHVKFYEPAGNFILVRILKEGLTSFQIFEHAIRQEMMIRDCSSFAELEGQYIRFCIMLPGQNDHLLSCLGEILK